MAMRRIQALLIAGLLGASGWLASPPDAAAQQVLRIGEFVTLTGPLAAYGNQLHRARALGLEEINARGGVNVGGSRYQVQLVSLDAGPPGEALKVFERLLSVEKVSLILDGLFSSTQYAMGPVLKGKNAIVIWSGGNDPGTTVGVPNAFRNHFDGGLPFMKVSGAFLQKVGAKRIAAYGNKGHVEFQKFVEEYLPKLPGVQVVATEWHSFGEKDFFPILTKLKGLKPDAVITHTIGSDMVTMVKQAREIGLYPGPLWINQSAMGPLMIDEESRKIMEGTYESLKSGSSGTTEPTPKARAFFEKYAKKYGERGFGPWTESGWDSLFIMAKAVEKAGTVSDVPKIIAALHELTTEDIPELLLQYKPGKIFDKEGQAYPKIIISQWKGGKHVQAYSDHGR